MNYPIKASLLPAVTFAVIGVVVLFIIQQVLVPEDGANMFARIVWGNFISPVIVGIFLVCWTTEADWKKSLQAAHSLIICWLTAGTNQNYLKTKIPDHLVKTSLNICKIPTLYHGFLYGPCRSSALSAPSGVLA